MAHVHASPQAFLNAGGSALECPLKGGMTAQRRPERPPQAEGLPHKASSALPKCSQGGRAAIFSNGGHS